MAICASVSADEGCTYTDASVDDKLWKALWTQARAERAAAERREKAKKRQKLNPGGCAARECCCIATRTVIPNDPVPPSEPDPGEQYRFEERVKKHEESFPRCTFCNKRAHSRCIADNGRCLRCKDAVATCMPIPAGYA